WTSTGATSTSPTSHTGAFSAMAGATTPTNGDSTLAQTFIAPAGAASLSLWYKMTCPDTITYDWATVSLQDNTSGSTAAPVGRFCATNAAWVQATAAVIAGHTYTLTLLSHDDNFQADPSFTLFDDVAIGLGGPPALSGISTARFQRGLAVLCSAGACETTGNSRWHGCPA